MPPPPLGGAPPPPPVVLLQVLLTPPPPPPPPLREAFGVDGRADEEARFAALVAAAGGRGHALHYDVATLEHIVLWMWARLQISPRDVVASCKALSALSESSLNAGKLRVCGAVGALLAALSAFPGNVEVCAPALYALAHVSSVDGECIARSSGEAGVLVALRTLGGASPAVAAAGCWCIANGATSAAGQASLGAVGAARDVVRVMVLHAASEMVQMPGCWALRNLAVADVNRGRIEKAGGVEACLEALSAHTTSRELLVHACAALANLAATESVSAAVAKAGGVEQSLVALVLGVNDARVTEHACSLIKNLAVRDSAERQLVKRGAVEALLVTLRTLPPSSPALPDCLGALYNVTYSRAGAARLAAATGARALLEGFTDHADAGVAVWATRVAART